MKLGPCATKKTGPTHQTSSTIVSYVPIALWPLFVLFSGSMVGSYDCTALPGCQSPSPTEKTKETIMHPAQTMPCTNNARSSTPPCQKIGKQKKKGVSLDLHRHSASPLYTVQTFPSGGPSSSPRSPEEQQPQCSGTSPSLHRAKRLAPDTQEGIRTCGVFCCLKSSHGC